jgi:hypothetical protein
VEVNASNPKRWSIRNPAGFGFRASLGVNKRSNNSGK